MSGFDQLHPALRHHIVNSLGWRDLRPFQEAVIEPILGGEHMVVLAPTAGGKTEAAFFPAMSRMLSENWNGLSLLYLCPIKALLNNLETRLDRYSTLLGRRAALWHGDVPTSQRRKILREPPDCLLTTPESLEVMLVSPRVESRRLFAGLQVVIIDEIHAFAGDDRGWHLLALLERIARLAGREFQRIGLSATVGNPDALLDWMAGSCSGPRRVSRPGPPPSGKQAADDADVQLDFVGSLENAATVISRLHRGEKRLVFVDSRARAERLSAELRELQVTTFVTHSSLSQEQRHQAEEAFASRDDCVIVATSVLELGVDVGDLDRVIQIDSPATVSSLLQRMGRTGRRSGMRRNCLFLATKDDTLVQAAGLIRLWAHGFVEPVTPPPRPLHVVAQQLMALVLQSGGVGRHEWFDAIRGVPGFAEIPRDQIGGLVEWMLQQEIVWEEAGILGIGKQGEKTFGRRNFMELLSVFTSPPIFTVLHGRWEIGTVDVSTFLSRQEGPRVLSLAGRAWKVNHVDWPRKRAYVEPVDAKGRSRWSGAGQGLGFELCQSIRRVLTSGGSPPQWSRRTRERIDALRHEFLWLDSESTIVLSTGVNEAEWWTHGGFRVNSVLGQQLTERLNVGVRPDSFRLRIGSPVTPEDVQAAIESIRGQPIDEMLPAIDEAAVDGLKFSECLPPPMAIEALSRRLQDPPATRAILGQPLRFVIP